MDEFSAKVPSHNWPKLNETQITFNELNVMLAKYQNPNEADAMTRIQQDLDETKIILVIIFYSLRLIYNILHFYKDLK